MKYNYSEYVVLFKALSDETRLKIMALLSVCELCACEILEDVNISQSTLSYHMKILSDCELVFSRQNGYWTTYWINQEKIEEIAAYLEEIATTSPFPCDKLAKKEQENL